MAVRRVVHDEVNDHPHPAILRRADQRDEVAERAQAVIDAVVIDDVVAVVAVRRRLKRHQPQAADPDPGKVVDPFHQTPDVTDAVAVPVEEGLDVEAVDHGVLPPQVARLGRCHPRTSGRTRSPKTSRNRACSWPTWWSARRSTLRSASSRSHFTCCAGSADTRTASVTWSGRTCSGAASNWVGSSRFQASSEPNTFVRHWWCAISRAFASLSAHERWTWIAIGLPSPPASRNASITRLSRCVGWRTVIRPSAQVPALRAVSSLTAAP